MTAIIVDLDGTLCDVSHRVHFVKASPPNWQGFFDACVDDTPNPAVAALVAMAARAHYAILYISGRPDSHRSQTEAWLAQHGLACHTRLLMRREGDYREDTAVKRELFDQYISGRWEIAFTVDDRNSVVAMWRGMGLACFQVREGAF